MTRIKIFNLWHDLIWDGTGTLGSSREIFNGVQTFIRETVNDSAELFYTDHGVAVRFDNNHYETLFRLKYSEYIL